MNPLRTIVMILAGLMQALSAQALCPMASNETAVCEMGCCAALADGLDGCGCSAGSDSPASQVPALPPATRESGQVAAALTEGGAVLMRGPEMAADGVRSAGWAGWKAHLPEVRLAVLFCSLLT